MVTNGTSTANKIVGMYSAPAGSTVLIDRNCHKSLTHLMMMSDITPIYFARPATPTVSSAVSAERIPACDHREARERNPERDLPVHGYHQLHL